MCTMDFNPICHSCDYVLPRRERESGSWCVLDLNVTADTCERYVNAEYVREIRRAEDASAEGRSTYAGD